MQDFETRVRELFSEYHALVDRPNEIVSSNGVFNRYRYPAVTRGHAPPFWQYDLDESRNPNLLMRLGVNTTFNAGAIKHDNKYLMVVRTEGYDVKSFFAVAESPNGVDQWRYWDHPIVMPVNDDPEKNVYDMRITRHEDGWIYGLFCAERKDASQPQDSSAALASCGIARTKDMRRWERLPDLQSSAAQQRNCVLHPEFVGGEYMIYTRPQSAFIETGDSGISVGFSKTMEGAQLGEERIVDRREYHTYKEVKNGMGPPPIKTEIGWLHLAHGVRRTAAGLRYVLYVFVADLKEPWRITHRPSGHLIEPLGEERVGDVSNVVFSNGWILDDDGTVFIYYASSDTRMHVATSTVDRLVDYAVNTPADPGRTELCAAQRTELIDSNLAVMRERFSDLLR